MEDKNLLYNLRLRLDAHHTVIKNHEYLAFELGVPADVRDRCKLNTTFSSTEKLLELLAAEKPELRVAEFISELENIGRNDVVETIKETLTGKKNQIILII